MTNAQRQKKLREKRLLNELCVACGMNKHEIGMIRCSDCRIKHNISSNTRKNRNKSNGLCACGDLATNGFKTCYKCRNNAKTRQEQVSKISYDLKVCKRCKIPSNGLFCDDCAKLLRSRSRMSREKLRDLVYQKYGGYICACCRECEKLFLTIDHIKNNGAAHRKSIMSGPGTSEHLYSWLRDNNFPQGFQVLCMNCNLGKQRNGGICPHKTRSA
jgi:hypothetical protein